MKKKKDHKLYGSIYLKCAEQENPQGFPGSSVIKESTRNVGDGCLIPGSGRSPGEGNGNPLQCSCLETIHGQRSLVGYSPWGHKSQTQLSN